MHWWWQRRCVNYEYCSDRWAYWSWQNGSGLLGSLVITISCGRNERKYFTLPTKCITIASVTYTKSPLYVISSWTKYNGNRMWVDPTESKAAIVITLTGTVETFTVIITLFSICFNTVSNKTFIKECAKREKQE